MPAMFVPLQELENLAPGTWYVNVLAAYPEHRGKGHGTALLGVADQLGADAGRRGLSIIVSDANTAPAGSTSAAATARSRGGRRSRRTGRRRAPTGCCW